MSSSRAQSCGVAFPRRRGAGSARRGISPAQGRGGGAGFLSRSGDLGERRPFSFRWFLRTENSSQRAPSPGLPFRLFCFWRNYPAGRLHKPGGVSSPVSIFSPLLVFVWLSTFHLKKKKKSKILLTPNVGSLHTGLPTTRTRPEEPLGLWDLASR